MLDEFNSVPGKTDDSPVPWQEDRLIRGGILALLLIGVTVAAYFVW